MKNLHDIIARRPAKSVADVIQILTDADQVLAEDDGLKWFNQLYLAVTTAVRDSLGHATFNDGPWLSKLDVVFANLFLDALGKADPDVSGAPSAWRPLLAARADKGLAKIQFALAGMNAHINRDLPVAIIEIYQMDRAGPQTASDRHYADYERVNGILDTIETQVKRVFTTGIIGVADVAAGQIDDILAMWSVRAARDAAWTHAELLWHLRRLPTLQNDFLMKLDNLTGFASRGLLTHVAAFKPADKHALGLEEGPT